MHEHIHKNTHTNIFIQYISKNGPHAMFFTVIRSLPSKTPTGDFGLMSDIPSFQHRRIEAIQVANGGPTTY